MPALHMRDIRIGTPGMAGDLAVPPGATSIVLFAHGSGSSRFSPRNVAVARDLNAHGIATLLLDLLTRQEETDRNNVFDIELLCDRLTAAIDWVKAEPDLRARPLGLFGASTGAAAALCAAAQRPDEVGAVVSRGGRPDLAGAMLGAVRAPTLLIVGGHDTGVIALNEQALTAMRGKHALEIVPGATHLFVEDGALEAVTALSVRWFKTHLGRVGDGLH